MKFCNHPSFRRILKGMGFLFFMGLLTIARGQESVSDSVKTFPLRINLMSLPISGTDVQNPDEFNAVLTDSGIQDFRLSPHQARNIRQTSENDSSGEFIIFREEWKGIEVKLPRIVSYQNYFNERSREDFYKHFLALALEYHKQENNTAKTEKIELLGANIAGQRVSLRVSGNINITGRVQRQQQSLVQATAYSNKNTNFRIDQKQQFNIEGKIGDRISVLVDQDSERDFDFENNLRIIYTGEEDNIFQKVEAGNVSLSLPSTQFVSYSAKNEGLFGLKSVMKMGGLDITSIASLERGENQKITFDGGTQSQDKIIKDIDYRRGTYFFVDKSFRRKFYPLNGTTHYIYGDSVIDEIEVYKRITSGAQEVGSYEGKAWIDPNDHDFYPEYMEQGIFKRMEPDIDYTVNLDLGYIRFNTPLQNDDVIGVAYRLTTAGDKTVTVATYGDWDRAPEDTSEIELKLIKPDNLIPDHPLWDLEFKNVYYLGASPIDPDGFDLKIVYINGATGNDDRDENGTSFLQIFGLDLYNESGENSPDEKPDKDNWAIFSYATGELLFPFLQPFYMETDTAGVFEGLRNPNLSKEAYSCSAIYEVNPNDRQALNAAHKFNIVAQYKNRSSTIDLGYMVIENSEELTLNGSPLVKDQDYTIDYFSGTLTLHNKEALNPNAKLDIKYQRNQFFQLDKKTLLGTRAQYNFGERSFIGATAMYLNQSVIDEKVDVGYEPMRNFIWDVNSRLDFDLDLVTRAVNWLPIVETDKPSKLAIEGEFAQVLPNPNSLNNPATGDHRGVAYIDDFEGSKRTTSPPIIRRYWNKSSVPLGKEEGQRGYFYWFNPYGGVLTTDIWPNKQTSVRAQNKFTDILTLVLKTTWSIDVVDGVCSPSDAWGGITYAFPSSYYDQSKSKFIEIWVKGDKGRFHIDLGSVSEDQNGNRKLDTEDKSTDEIMQNNLLDPGEDVGIDGVSDVDEYIVTNFGDTLRYGDERLKKYRRDPQDPHSDNWSYKEGSTNYTKTNGTEGNSHDVSGNYPDTEDLDRNFGLDTDNAYFTFDFDLSDPTLVAGRTSKGWKLVRVPLHMFRKETEGALDIDWQQIQFCRVWIDEVPSTDTVIAVSVAKIEMVGNEWEELGIARDDSSDFQPDDETFAITVINSEENPDRYESPQGVQGEYDRVNEIRAKEQSLVLWFNGNGLQPGSVAAAKKDLLEIQDYTQYRMLKMFIRGENVRDGTGKLIGDDYTPLEFFLRIGQKGGLPQYYEMTKPVKPGWKEELVIDLDELTQLKNVQSSDSAAHISVDYLNGSKLVILEKTDKNGNPTGEKLKVIGNPSLNRVGYLVVGLRNLNSVGKSDKELQEASGNKYGNSYLESLFGEVWIDELRLSNVRRDPGIAMRANANFTIADLGKINLSVNRQDADFHRVQERLGKNTSTKNFSVNANLNLNKFFPQEWGLSLPVSANYSQKVSTPKYLPGTDILSGDAPPDSVLNKNFSKGVSSSFDKTTHSDFWLLKYTIDEINGSFSAKWTEGSNENTLRNYSESYSGNLGYGVPFGRDNYFRPFKKLEQVKYIGNTLGDFRFYYLPSKLSFKMAGTESKSENTSRIGRKYTENYNFTINRNLDFQYKIFENLTFSFTKNIKSNMKDFRGRKLDAVKELNPGIITDVSENYSMNFNPKITSWLTPNFTYSSNYRWSEPINSQTEYIDVLSNQNRLSSNLNLSLKSVMESFYKPSGTVGRRSQTTGGRRPAGRRPGVKNTTQEEKPEKSSDNKILLFIYKGISKIKPISITWSMNNSIANNGRIGTAPILYRAGFLKDPGLPIDSLNVGQSLENISRKMDYSLRSGFDITSNIVTGFSHGRSRSKTIGQGGRTNINTSVDFFPLGENGKRGFPFVGWTIRWSGLQKIKYLNNYFSNISLDHAFNGKETVIEQNGQETSSSYMRNFSPLLGISAQLKNGVSSTLRLNQGLQINNNQSGTERVSSKNYTITASYQHRGGLKIPIFFFRDFDLQNNIQFSFSMDYTENVTEGRNNSSGKFSVLRANKSLRVKPQINYSFTKKVNGGIFFEYRETNDKLTGKHITRDYGFDVNIAIRG